MNVRVWKINDCEWWAGEGDAEAILAAYMNETGCSREDAVGGDTELPELVTDAELDTLLFTDTDEDENAVGEPRTWRAELERMVAAGVRFPILFASTEY